MRSYIWSLVALAVLIAQACSAPIEDVAPRDEWSDLRRPLSLAKLDTGTACPTTPWRPLGELNAPSGLGTSHFTVIGTGPVYPIIYNFDRSVEGLPFRLMVGGDPPKPKSPFGEVRWMKVRWPIEATYAGPLLVRGARLDGPGDLLFDEPDPNEWRVAAGGAVVGLEGWRHYLGGFGVSGPGCYGIQIDGATFMQILVLQVT